MDRRRFVRDSVGAGLLVASGGCAGSEADAAVDQADSSGVGARMGTFDIRWGVQLYTLRELMANDVEATLAEVARIGYDEVEFAGYFGRAPAQIRAALAAEGLSSPSTHLGLGEIRDRLDEWLETAEVIGHRYLILPSIPAADRADIEAYRRLSDEMNVVGERCRTAGVRFGFHNHDVELRPVGGDTPLDVLIQYTDPDLVTFEIDLFWVVHGGGDPIDYLQRYPDRFELCHVKDKAANGDMVDVGAGVIDFASIFAQADAMIHYLVEHDTPGDPIDSIQASYTHLSSLGV